MVKHKKFLCIVLILIPYLLISGCGSKNDIPNNAAIFEDEISVDLMGRTFLIYERNAESMNKINWDYIEKKYNCKILFESPPSRTGNIDTDTASVISAVNSGNFKADAFILYPSLDFISLVSNKAIVPLDEYIDFNNEFLNDPAQNVSYFNGRYYGIAPSIVRQKKWAYVL